jgi:ATP-binding cassette, subfamily B, bacterial
VIWSTWRQLSEMVAHPNRRLLAAAVSGTVAGLAEAAALVLVVRTAVDLAIDADDSPPLSAMLGGLSSAGQLGVAAALLVAAMLLHAVIASTSARIYSDVLFHSRDRVLDSFGRASAERQTHEREGALQETVATLAAQSAQLATNFVGGCAALLGLIAVISVAAVVQPFATLVVVVFGVFLLAALRPLMLVTKRRAHRFVRANSAFAEDVAKSSSLAMEYRVFGVRDAANRDLRAANGATAQLGRRVRFVQRLGWALYRDVAMMFLVVAVGLLVLAGGEALLGAGTVVVLVVRALASAQSVQRSAQTVYELAPNLDTLLDRLASLDAASVSDGDRTLDDILAIEFDDVSYDYVAGDGALKDVTLRIDAGEVLGVLGPSGGGKSTFVQLLLRLRTPRSGRVLVNGEPYETFREQDWTRLVSLVPQEPQLMEGTIAENIRFLRPDIDDATVERCARAAHVADEIHAMPDGFSTVLGPRGVGLSGGQKQRLAIARALAGSPQLVVLDEPTSALDERSERLIRATIDELRGRVTMVIVAHRLTTLQSCERFVMLSDGRLESVGMPVELAADRPLRAGDTGG